VSVVVFCNSKSSGIPAMGLEDQFFPKWGGIRLSLTGLARSSRRDLYEAGVEKPLLFVEAQ